MVDTILSFLNRFGLKPAYTLSVLGVVLFFFVGFSVLQISQSTVISFMVGTSPIWLPIMLFFLFFDQWMLFIRQQFKNDSYQRVTLEILLPQEVFKSPLAMELFLNQLWQKASPDNLVQVYWDGKHPPTFGLEMCAYDGQVHFYINTPKKKFKHIIETQLYAQYPGIEIRELPVDYTAEIVWDEGQFEVFGLHFGLRKPDAYPIKTYIDYGLDQNPKEEEKIDPLTSVIDMLGSIGPGERIWFQILINSHAGKALDTGNLLSRPDWKEDIKKEINTIMQRDESGKSSQVDFEGMPRITEGERDTVKALERSMSKYPFNTSIRVMYVAKKDAYQPGERIGALITTWFQFNDKGRNEFGLTWRTDVDLPWIQDPTGKRRERFKKNDLKYYKLRSHVPHEESDIGTYILSVEELATIFHLPGKVAYTPGLGRIPSTRGEAPPNLPTGV